MLAHEWLWFAGYAVALMVGISVCRRFGRGRIFVWLLAAATGAAWLGWGALHPVDWDEVEHLHSAYLVSEGLVPFQDFWQIHSPMLWIVMAPVLKALPHAGLDLVLSRVACLALTGLLFGLVWRLARRLWGTDADLPTTLLVFLSISIVSQFLLLRPDLVMLLGSLGSLEFALAGYERNRGRSFFLGGLVLAFSLTFTHKIALWLLVVPLSSLFVYRRDWRSILRAQVFHAAGILAGALPLALYLTAHGLRGSFQQWAMAYHRPGLFLHLSPNTGQVLILFATTGAIAVGGLILLPARPGRAPRAVLGAALVLVAISGLLIYPLEDPWSRYYMAPLFLLAAALSSWIRPVLEARGDRLRAVVLFGLLLAGLGYSHVRYALELRHRATTWSGDLETIDALQARARGPRVYCVFPYHPVFRRDASQLYLPWQFIHLEGRANTVKKRMLLAFLRTRPSFAAELMQYEPAIVDPDRLQRAARVLEEHGLLKPEEARNLHGWIEQNYQPETIGHQRFRVRNPER